MTIREAQCQCGQLRVRASGEPVSVSVCHCLDCQRRSGSVFATQARFAADRVEIIGLAQKWSRNGDEGGVGVFSFCATCGSTVYYRTDAEPDVVAIAVGAFGDPQFPAPGRSGYEERRHTWVSIAGDIEHHD